MRVYPQAFASMIFAGLQIPSLTKSIGFEIEAIHNVLIGNSHVI